MAGSCYGGIVRVVYSYFKTVFSYAYLAKFVFQHCYTIFNGLVLERITSIYKMQKRNEHKCTHLIIFDNHRRT